MCASEAKYLNRRDGENKRIAVHGKFFYSSVKPGNQIELCVVRFILDATNDGQKTDTTDRHTPKYIIQCAYTSAAISKNEDTKQRTHSRFHVSKLKKATALQRKTKKKKKQTKEKK